jgi:hypothetical protein
MFKRLITCEGCYCIVFLFHLRFMLHLAGIKRTILPFYFLRDLNKMDMRVQVNPKNPPHKSFHQGLITFLVKAELGKLQKIWDQFLIQSGYEKENHAFASQSHVNIVKPDQETPASVIQSTPAKKG